MTIRPTARLPHPRRLGAVATGLLVAGALIVPPTVSAFTLLFQDNITTNEDTAKTGNVLSNDWLIGAGTTTVTGVGSVSPTVGTLVIASNGAYTFTPAANWHGTANTTYTVHNDDGNNTGQIKITVNSVNDAPVAVNDTVTTTEDTTTANISATIRANDTDVDGDTLTISAVSGSTGGTATRSGGGATVTFAPSANLCGPGAGGFDYTISDGHGGTANGHVTVDVTCVNDAPVANDDTLALTEDQAADVTATVLANDTDIDGDTLVVSDVQNTVGGLATLDAGALTFTPAANACGLGIGGFDYTVSDGAGGTSTAHVGINVACVNDAPVATDDAATTNEDNQLVVTAFDMLGNDSDVEFDALTVTGIDNVTGGNASLNAGDVTFDPTANLCGAAAGGYDYTVDDGNGGTDTGHVTIDITCVNDNPLAASDAFAGTEDTNVVISGGDLTGNDSDVDGDALTVSAAWNATGGSVDLTDDVLTFTPDANLCGIAAAGFDYSVSDGNGGTDTAHVTIDVGCVNDAPVATDDAASGTEDTDVAIAGGDLTGNDSDIEGDTLTVTHVSNATGGSATVAAGDVTFTPDENLCGEGAGSFDYTVDDGNDGTDIGHVVVDLTCVNDNPSAGNGTVTVAEDSADNDVTEDVLANDSDVDGDTVHVSDVSNATGGSVDLAAGVVTFTPDADACGNGYGSFDYEISDGNGGTADGHAEVNVTCVDDAPVATDDAKTGTEDTDVVLTGSFLTGNDTDTDTDQADLTVTTVANLVGGIAEVNDGDVTFHPAANLCGNNAASFDYTVDDGSGGTDVGHVTIDLTCVNDAPTGVDDSAMVDENSAAADYDVLANDTDVEGDTLSLVSVGTVTSSSAPSAGTASKQGDMVRFTPAPMFHGQAHISYTLTDGEDTAQATLTVTVGPDVDAPVVAKPTVAFGAGRVNESAPLRITWSAVDAGVGVATYDVQVSIAGGAFRPVYSGPNTSVTKLYPFRKTLVWRVRATDHEGNRLGLGLLGDSQDRPDPEQQQAHPLCGHLEGHPPAGRLGRGLHLRHEPRQPRHRLVQRAIRALRRTQVEGLGLRQGVRGRRAHRPLQAPQQHDAHGPDRDPVRLVGQRPPPDPDRQRQEREARQPRRVHRPQVARPSLAASDAAGTAGGVADSADSASTGRTFGGFRHPVRSRTLISSGVFGGAVHPPCSVRDRQRDHPSAHERAASPRARRRHRARARQHAPRARRRHGRQRATPPDHRHHHDQRGHAVVRQCPHERHERRAGPAHRHRPGGAQPDHRHAHHRRRRQLRVHAGCELERHRVHDLRRRQQQAHAHGHDQHHRARGQRRPNGE